MLRRLVLLGLAALLPAGALAQTAGTITFNPQDEFINATECGGGTVTFNWTLQPDVTFVQGGTIRVFSSNTAPPSTGTDAGYCAEAPVSNGATAGQVGSDITGVTGVSGTAQVNTAQIITAAGYTCTDTIRRTVYVCVHYRPPSSSTRSAKASATMVLQIAAPNAPTLTSADPGDTKIFASWTKATTGEDATRFQLSAIPAAGGAEILSGELTGTSGEIGGLANGTSYQVRVRGLSEGKNPSTFSNSLLAEPAATQGFWDTYKDLNGVEEGGCAAGSGGLLAFLGLAALARARRKP